MTFIIYLILAGIVTALLAARTDRKVLAFILLFWLFCHPVLNSVLVLDIAALPFDIQANRYLFLALLAYLGFAVFSQGKRVSYIASGARIPNPQFEKWFYLYFVAVAVSTIANFDQIRWQSIFVHPFDVVVFIVLYHVSKKFVTPLVFEALLRGIIVLSVISSIIALYQIAVDSLFFRVTYEHRVAFGNVIRSSGPFQSEYELGYFQILAMIVALARYKGSRWPYLLLPLLVVSVLVTFHRMDYIIMTVCLASYFLIYGRTLQKIGAVAGMVAMAIVLLVALMMGAGQSDVVQGRLKDDTVTGRIQQSVTFFREIATNPLGYGAYENRRFTDVSLRHNMMRSVYDRYGNWSQAPLLLHNGYIEVGALHGVFAVGIFIVILVSYLRYFRNAAKSIRLYVIPTYGIVILMIANFTNAIASFKTHYILLLGLLAGAFVAMYPYLSSAVLGVGVKTNEAQRPRHKQTNEKAR